MWSVNAPTALMIRVGQRERQYASFFMCYYTMSNSIIKHHDVNNSSIMMTGQSSEMDYITSIQIAEITGKQHSNVLRDIRNLLEQVEDRAAFNFELGVYRDANYR